MHRRPLRPPRPARLRRWIARRLPRLARSAVRLRDRSGRRPDAHHEPDVDALADALGNLYGLRVLHVSPLTPSRGRSWRQAGALVVCADPDEIERLPPDAFDVAVAIGTTIDLDLLLDRVQAVLTDQPPSEGQDSHPTRAGHPLVCRSFDPPVNGTTFRSVRTRVRYEGGPLGRRRRYVDAVHPHTGATVFVKWIGNGSGDGRSEARERAELHREVAAHHALQASAIVPRHLPHLIDAEVTDTHGALVFEPFAVTPLDDPALGLDLATARSVLREVVDALVDLLDLTGLHHNDVEPHNIGVGTPCVLFDLAHASPDRRRPFADEITRLTSAIRDRLHAADHDDWDDLVGGLPIDGPHAVLAQLGREQVALSR